MSPRQPSRRDFLGALAVGAGAVLGMARPSFGADRLVVYSTTLPPIQARLAAAFMAKTGIAVQSVRLPTSPLAQRFMAEQKAGQPGCDIITLGHDIFFQEVSRAGLLADIDGIPGVQELPPQWRPGSRFTTILVAPHSIGYNTNLVKGDLIPRTWADVLRPNFAGQIIFADPRANEPILDFLATLNDALGDEFIRKLGAQKPRYVPAIPQGVEQVIAGEAMLYMPALAMNLVQYKDFNAPISIIPTPSPTSGTYFFSAIPANAPNMAGARKWYEYVLSQEGQEILCRDNGISPLGEIPGSLKAPASLVPPNLSESIKRAGKIYDLLGLTG